MPSKGSDTCALGLLPHRLCLFALRDVFLCLAQTTTFYLPVPSSVGSPGQFLPFMWGSDLHSER